MWLKKVLAGLEQIIENLQEEENLIIVEGKKDLHSLNQFNIKAVEIKGPIYKFVEKISSNHKKVILLLDTDKKGKKLTKRLVTEFQKYGVKVNLRCWKWLKKAKISHVEGLFTRFIKGGV